MSEYPSRHLSPRDDLPVPRIEIVHECRTDLRDRYTAIWYQRLVLRHYSLGVWVLDIGQTLTTETDPLSAGKSPAQEHATISTPFRMGVDVRWDALQLNLPAYAIVGAVVEQQEPLPPGTRAVGQAAE